MGQLHPDRVGLGDLRRLDRPLPDIVLHHVEARTHRAARRDARVDAGQGDRMTEAALHGIVGEFPALPGVVAAAHELRQAGFRHLDAYTPYPVEELNEAVHSGHRIWLGLATLAGAVFGAVTSTFVQYWAAAIDYPLNIGGRPYNSRPPSSPPRLAVTLLFAPAPGFLSLSSP